VPLFASHRARGERGHIQHLAERSLHLTSLLSIGCFYLIHHFSDELSFLLFGSVEAGAYIRPLSWVIPLMFLDHVTDGILKGLGEEVYTMWVNILDAILSCLLVVLLLPHFGAIGYVYVILLAEIFNFLFSIWRLYRVSALRYRILPSLVVPALSGWCAVRVVSLFFSTVASPSASLLPLLLRLIFTASFYILLLSLASHIHFWRGKRRRALDTDRHIMYTI
jgi:stage V sporulation protein B